MSRQQEFICGLSHEVTIAVLPRLNMEELMFELNRRIQNLDTEKSIKDRLVNILRDVMLEEYRQLERKSQVGYQDKMTIPAQELEASTMHDSDTIAYVEIVPSASGTPTFSTQVLDTNSPTSNFCIDKPLEKACEETPLASFQHFQDHDDIPLKMECHVSQDDQISQTSEQSSPDCLERYTDDRETCAMNSKCEQDEQIRSEDTPLPSGQPTPGQFLLPDNDSQIDCKRYTCDMCGFKTSFAQEFSKHKQCHKGGKPFLCDKCGYRASEKYQLNCHIVRKHTGEKPFKCNQCNFRTAVKCRLSQHLKRHTDEKPYSCEICDYRTYRKFDVKTHMRRHAGVKPYKCEECDYRTAYKPGLIRHRRCHTGERPYSCQECDYKAAEKGSLVRHRRNKHQ
ncbi:uncharacterized protein LOC144865650 [Branchiostoma floridae x Branchiostoma japonicum]